MLRSLRRVHPLRSLNRRTRCYATKTALGEAAQVQKEADGPKKIRKRRSKAEAAAQPTTTLSGTSSTPSSHDNLTSFLQHARETNLSTRSTVYVGTHYEYTALESLKRLGFALHRTAGRGDQGIDLLGHWTTPSAAMPLRVLMQCKALSRSLSPDRIRELEGAFVGAPAGWKGEGVLGFMVATKEATQGVREALQRSRWPIGYIMVEKEGDIKQLLWNHVAQSCGLEGLGVGTKFTEALDDDDDAAGELKEEIALLWQGALVKTSAS